MFRSGPWLAFAIGLLLLLAGMNAMALVPSSSQPQYRATSSYPWVSDTSSACTVYIEDQSSASSAFVITFNSVSGLECYAKYTDRSNGQVVTANTVIITLQQQTATNVCPANSTSVSGGCQCSSGYQENAAKTACEPASSDAEKFCQSMTGLTINTGGSGSIPTSSCHMPEPPFDAPEQGKGCGVTIGDAVKYPGEDGKTIWSGVGKFGGGTCTPGATPDAEPQKSEADKCPGGFSGTVSGVEKCVPVEPDKGIEGVKTGSSTDADGTKKDVKEETKCEGSKCTTTTTTTSTTASGTVTTSTSSTTESLTDKCAKDPSNQVCQKTNGGTGSAASQSSCQTNPSASGCGGAGVDIGGLYTGKEETVKGIMDQAVADLKSSGIGGAVDGFFTVSGGGSCPSMVWDISYVNKTVSLPGLCSEMAAQIFTVLRGVLLVVAGVFAFRAAIDN